MRFGEEVVADIRPESFEASKEASKEAMEAEVLLEEGLGCCNLLTVQVGG